jgi:chemotaxis protein CheD
VTVSLDMRVSSAANIVAQPIVTVDMGEIGVAHGAQRLRTIGVGSCIAIVIFARDQQLAALAHCLLPAREDASERATKYVDSAVPELLSALRRRGATPPYVAALIGGASMFPGLSNLLMRDIAGGNIHTARTVLHAMSIPIICEDLGGHAGRSVLVDVAEQRVMVRTIRGGDRWL